MPDLNLTTAVTSAIVLLLLALPFLAARIQRPPNTRLLPSRGIDKAGPGPGFTYALVPPGGHPETDGSDPKGSWQWCLAFVPEETSDGGSEMPPWWAPAPPWDSTAEFDDRFFTHDAEALQAIFEETSVYPAMTSTGS